MPSYYELIGGDAVVRNLVSLFYKEMDTAPEARGIREMHPQNLAGSEEKLYLFLSGWLGGPQLYIERFGHPRLRARHLPFAIADSERDQWMNCMRKALLLIQIPEPLRAEIEEKFQQLATHMINKEPENVGVLKSRTT